MYSLLSGPPEVICRILESCDDFPQLFAFISTCKGLHSVWMASRGTIIWKIGNLNIVSFDDALMAVRATEIIKSAHQSGNRPPDPFPIDELSGRIRKPDPLELKGILDLHHLMLCIEYMILHRRMKWLSEFAYDPTWTPDEVFDPLEEWRPNLHRALYRVILLGAVCSRAYAEPLFAAVEQKNTDIARKLLIRRRPVVVLQELDGYLRKFPVYNYDANVTSDRGKWRDHEYDSIFGPLAKWIVEDGRARHLERDLGEPGEDERRGSVREILHLLAAYMHLTTKIVNGDAAWDLGRLAFNNLGQLSYDFRGQKTVDASKHEFKGTTRTVTVVLFGVFQPEEITMPARVEDTVDCLLVANPYPNERETEGTTLGLVGQEEISPTAFFDIPNLLHRTQPPVPPPITEFFRYTLRKYFNLRIFDALFDASDRGLMEEGFFLAWPHLFCNGERQNLTTDYDAPMYGNYL